MSTPVKPPGGSPPGEPAPAGADAGRVEGRPGELRRLVDEAGQGEASVQEARSDAASRLGSVGADLAAGRIGVDEAIERIVQRTLGRAAGLSEAHRGALEAQLRAALLEDPTLLALRKDLERGSQTS